MIAYNQEVTIDEAIRSVVLQRAPFRFELVVADDASTDGTAGRAARWQQEYPDIVRLVRREKNLGLQANFLDAWSRCRGEYIAICEGDDHWCSRHKLRRQAEWLDSHPECALTFHRVVNHYADTGTLSLSNPRQKSDLTLEDLARGNVITNLSVMYRAIPYEQLPEWIREVKLFDYAFHSLHAERGTAHYLRQPMAVYRRYSRGIWSGDNHRAWLLALDIREHLMEHFRLTRPEATTAYLRAYCSIAVALMADGVDAETTMERLAAAWRRYAGCELRIDEVMREVAGRRAASASRPGTAALLRRGISALRAAVSRFLPVPRI